VLEAGEPFIVNTRNGERLGQTPRVHGLDEPMRTVTATGSQGALVAAWLAKHYGGVVGQDLRRPLGTVTAKDHHSLVAAFLLKYYGQGSQWQGLAEPLHTIVSKARFGLVTVTIGGEEYAIVDIGMRMLEPRELARAQGFADDYELTGTKTSQIARIGNSVSPPVAEALARAQWEAPAPRRTSRPVQMPVFRGDQEIAA
jgi:DNA (cytosine-5)-methyltransferase 1